MNDRERKLNVIELLFSVAWFALDGAWLLKLSKTTYVLSLIALAGVTARFWLLERRQTTILVALAETSWLIMNVFWIRSDLSSINWCLSVAQIFLALGFAFLLAAFMAGDKKDRIEQLFMRPFRRLRAAFLK